MASEISSVPVNGNYAPHQGYGGVEQQNNNSTNHATATSTPAVTAAPATSTAAATNGQADIPKDEVGWFFVEQYYTTLSRSPEKLYLFYAKRSQFVSGQETDKVQVCVGQRAINDKIKELDFQDCKVRVTNVDSQSSDTNIVIQVVGEISNKSQPHKKFVQTFVLATQTNGYFVLNDIFRYLVEEEDDFEADAPPQTGEVQQIAGASADQQEPASAAEDLKTLTSSTDPAAIESDAKKVAQELENKLGSEQTVALPAVVAPVNGEASPAPTTEEVDTVGSQPDVPPKSTSEIIPEKPKEPEPTPSASPLPKAAAPQTTAVPKPAVPAAPKTWANLAAQAVKVATPATPITPAPAAASSAPASRETPPGSKPSAPTAPSAAAPAPTPAAPPSTSTQPSDAQGNDSQDEWTAVGGGHSRQQSRQVTVAQPEAPQYRGYIKNVFEHIDAVELRSALEKFGELAYFDISRPKNCAFVDFKTADGYNKAISSPIQLGDDKLAVIERHIRPGSTPYVPRGQFQGGRGGRGGGVGQGQGGPRGGFQGGRGNYNPRGRGGAGSQRGGRGATQT